MSNPVYDVIIIGGSYSGLAAAMTLGRSLKQVLVIDSDQPCNQQTPHSHNFLTRDGDSPQAIAGIAREQALKYPTVAWAYDQATRAIKQVDTLYIIETASGRSFFSKKVHLATGVKDLLPQIPGLAACWGISVIHCPFCHGYEVHGRKTGFLGNGDAAFRKINLLLNWTRELILFTNGPCTLTSEQLAFLNDKQIPVLDAAIESLEHTQGKLQQINFSNATSFSVNVLYAEIPVELSTDIPHQLGCALTEDGLIQVDALQRTTAAGVTASGDCAMRMRSVALSVAGGHKAGMTMLQSFVFPE